MAKKSKSRTRETDSDRTERTRPQRRVKRKGRRLALLFLLLLGILVALPTIVANTPARDTLLGWSLPDNGWAATSQGATLSWTGTQSIQGLRIVDPQGKELLTCQNVELDRSMLSLVTDSKDLGRLLIEQPRLTVVTRPDGSNVEDLIRDLSRQQGDEQVDQTVGESRSISLQIELVDGTISGQDEVTGESWSIQEGKVSAQLADSTSGGASVRCSGTLQSGDASRQGDMELRVEQTGDRQFKVNAISDRLPLLPLKPWLARLFPEVNFEGDVSTDAQCLLAFDEQNEVHLQSTGRLDARGLTVEPSSPELDGLQFASLQVPWELNLDSQQLHVKRLRLESDWSRLDAQGSFNLSELSEINLEKLPQATGTVSGNVQLNRLAEMLPNTLQIREGVSIKSGELAFNAEARPGSEGAVWKASATVSKVSGSDGRRVIRWEEPIEAACTITENDSGPVVEEVSLESSFASADFQTGDARVTGSFRFNLQNLSNELAKFVDMEGWKFQGRGEGELSYVPGSNDQFQASTEVKLTELNVTQLEKLVWAEPKLQVSATASGSVVDFAPKQLTSAELHLFGARDRLDAELLQAVSLDQGAEPWKIAVEATGPLASWAGRLRPWIDAVPEQLEGEARLQATALASGGYVELLDSSGSVANLQVRNGSMLIDEPRVEFAGDFRWDPNTGDIASRDATFQSSTMTFRSQGVLVQLGGESIPKAEGKIAFRANLERLSAAAGLIQTQSATWARGLAAGELELTSDGKRLSATLNAEADQLAILKADGSKGSRRQPKIAWSEPRLKSESRLVYDPSRDRLTLEKLTLVGDTLRLDASSGVEQLRTVGNLKASGALQYDSQALEKLLSTYLGPDVRLLGDRVVRFELSGQLHGDEGVAAHWSDKWNATAEAGWTEGNVFGLAVGNGRLSGELKQGQLQIAPLDVVVGEGRITARPVANLAPGAEQIILPRGPLISNVTISPEVSDAMLKYVAPILAGATRTEGRFSLQLQEARVPLLAPEQARALGKFDIHSLKVTPGPLVQDIAAIVGQLQAVAEKRNFLRAATGTREVKLLSMNDGQIEFQVHDGRVYHRKLEFLVDDVPVTSTGSVGFDQTLAIDFEVEIQNKWLGDKPAFRSLAGQKLRIPVRGSFKNPKIDASAVANLSQKLLEGAANQVIGDELNRALDKLFK